MQITALRVSCNRSWKDGISVNRACYSIMRPKVWILAPMFGGLQVPVTPALGI